MIPNALTNVNSLNLIVKCNQMTNWQSWYIILVFCRRFIYQSNLQESAHVSGNYQSWQIRIYVKY